MQPIFTTLERHNLKTLTDSFQTLETAYASTETVASLTKRQTDLITIKHQLFGVEAARAREIDSELHDISAQLKKLQHELDMRSGGFDKFCTLEPLWWRHKKTNLPLLAVFTLDSPEMKFSIAKSMSGATVKNEINPGNTQFPSLMKGAYGDVWSAIQICTQSAEIRLQRPALAAVASLSGGIPSGARSRLREAVSKKVFQPSSGGPLLPPYIYLLVEVEKWELFVDSSRQKAGSLRSQVIAVGFSDNYPQKLWHICSFELEPLSSRKLVI